MTLVPGVPRIRRVVAFDREGAVRPTDASGRTVLPFPITRGLVVDSILEFVGRLDIGGAAILVDRSGVVRPDGVGDGLVWVLRYPGRSNVPPA